MRLLSFGECFCIALLSTLLFFLGGAISAATYADLPPEWERSCTVALTDKGNAQLSCGDVDEIVEVDSRVRAALRDTELQVTCMGRRTRGVFAYTYVECP